MDTLTLDRVSDKQIDEEYRKRFFLQAGDKLTNAEDAAKHFNVLLLSKDPAREHFGVIYLNGANKVITSEILFSGSLTTSQVHPREIIKRSLEENSAAIVCGHNHPSGNKNPSQDDLRITKKIKTACETVDMTLHDHVIVTSEGYYSFADRGLL